MATTADTPLSRKAVRVLIVEDSQDDVELVVAELRRGGYDVTWRRVDTGAALEAQLTTGEWDIVISDHDLPGFCAPDALRLVREQAGSLPFIIVSGSIGEAQAVAVMRAGANDYLLKGQLARLTPAVERELAEAAERRRREETERALKRTEEQLRQAQKMEAIGRLAGGIAHDFNNLLTAILGYSELVLSSLPEEASGRTDVEEIRRAGERAAGLTRQLLAFSRQQVLDARVVHVDDIIREVETLLRRVIGEDIELCVNLDDALQTIKVDSGQFEQVLMNLAINARDAMPAGGRITVRTRLRHLSQSLQIHDVVLRPGPYVFIAVTDTGTGMSPETMARVFEPFFTTKEPGKGTGLGLATVYGIVRQSDGAISVDSQLGQGTEFGIFLPCANAPLQRGVHDVDAPVSVTGSESILVVDDEAGIRALVHRTLEPLGYTVLTAAHGREALDVASKCDGPLHLLITDIVMPQMGGRELAARLSDARRALPVLFLSGYPDSTQVNAALTDPAHGFIMKPFTPTTLARKVRELLNQNADAPSHDQGASH